MRKPRKPKYQRVDALFQAILEEVNGSFPSSLSLVGAKPDFWPVDKTPEWQRLVHRIKVGVAFYFTEDFLSTKNTNGVWAGSYWRGYDKHLYKLGENGLASYTDFMGIPDKRRFVQPVALRTFEDAGVYHRTGLVYGRHTFEGATSRWLLRHPSEVDAAGKEIRNRIFQRGHLYYHGDYVSRTVECLLPEVGYVLGVGPYEPHLPPSKAFEFSFERQLQHLIEAWKSENPNQYEIPALEWVRENLSHPFIAAQPVNDGYALAYRKKLKAIFNQK